MKMRAVFLGMILLACVAASFAQSRSNLNAEAIVMDLYKVHDAHKGPFSQTENRDRVDQYFTRELADLIWKDAVAANGEVGALDFDPLYDSQDPQITEFKIGKVKSGGETEAGPKKAPAMLDVTFKDSGKPVKIGFQLEQDPNKTWKIADIHYPDGRSLRAILRGG